MKTIKRLEPIEVYFNLHKKVFSVRQSGLVVKHIDIIIIKDANFVVSQAGRERVLREKRKNVHAFVRGKVCYNENFSKGSSKWANTLLGNYEAGNLVKTAHYNPYKTKTFVDSDNNPVTSAKTVYMVIDEKKPKIYFVP